MGGSQNKFLIAFCKTLSILLQGKVFWILRRQTICGQKPSILKFEWSRSAAIYKKKLNSSDKVRCEVWKRNFISFTKQ